MSKSLYNTLKVSLSKLDGQSSKSPKTLAILVSTSGEKDTSKSSPKNTLVTPKLSKELNSLLSQVQTNGAFSGNKKETLFYRAANVDGFENILFVGLGPSKSVNGDVLKTAAAIMIGKLKAEKIRSASVMGSSLSSRDNKTSKKGLEEALQSFAEGLWLSVYDYTDLKTSKKTKDAYEFESVEIGLDQVPTASAKDALETADIISDCQNFARHLGDSPGNYMTPTLLAKAAADAAKGTKLKVVSWDKTKIKKEGFGGLLAVASGSDQEPRFITMEYKGAAASKKPICFVGKGLTFDAGGISIKPSQGMEEMKYDMCGGANVIGTMVAIARLGLKINAIAFVPSTENLLGPSAIKPGDVYTARNGKTVEVFNTDAEGRLILSDALSYASEQKPAVIIDTATLTGAILIALGNTYTGVFTRDKKFMGQIQSAADSACELVWPMPIDDFHVEDMKGTHADLCNISGGRLAGSSTAAAFLEQFVDKDIPWAHFDVAGTAWNINSRFPYHPRKGATGIMIRTFLEIAKAY